MYCTLICCMDGRFNMAVNEYIRVKYGYVYVATITDAGPVAKIIYNDYLKAIEDKIIQISINRHDSKHIFIAGHHDCAGCPVDDDQQKDYIRRATHLIKKDIPSVRVTGIFIDDDFNSNILKTWSDCSSLIVFLDDDSWLLMFFPPNYHYSMKRAWPSSKIDG